MSYEQEDIMLKRVLFLFSVVIMVNLLLLDLKEVGVFESKDLANVLGKSSATAQSTCPQACLTEIKKVSSVGGSGGLTTTKESFVPIGTGVSSAEDWEDVPGLQVIVDTARYGKIKESYFEASVHVANTNQIVYVRLYNVTDKHPVWFSELVFPNAITAASQTSPKITLDTGNKAYKVQMKTQLKYTATLDQSRIRILSQ